MSEGLIFPYPSDTAVTWERIDQGQDLRAPVGTPVLAVAAGTIVYAHDAAGFGDPYPVLRLNTPQPDGTAVYYGHQHPEVAEGTHVTQGQVIAHAAQVPGGNAANDPGWLEIGWWRDGPTGDGQAMHDALTTITNPPGGFDVATLPTLQLGSMGHEVKVAQAVLNIDNAGIAVDGNYGPTTEQKVKDFQTFLHLAVDGVVGPNTWAALLTEGA